MCPAFRVLITDRAWPDCSLERSLLASVGAEVVEAPQSDEATLIELARDADAIGTNWAQVTDEVIRAASRCRIVARFGIGLDNIAVTTATEFGIPVTNVPDYCVPEVSDHALALLLAAARNVAFFHQRTKAGEYQLSAGPAMRRLSGATLGLIGFGQIARALFPKARALGMNVLAHSRRLDDGGTGCRMVSLDELLTQSDFISLHAPLSESTHHLISRPQLARMKPTAWLINTSRGGLIDAAALLEALNAGRIGGAALDVFEPEPPDLSDALYRDERVIVTPHAAFLSEESLREVRTRASRQMADALRGARPENVVNPEVYARTT
ncbi:MAG TPA: C-terminal binding protein [Planctomycetaceae bacterium]|jgi:D-3-phosphoglycerate dehydrogenase|nr:C-terminal binding protein [Planctomycetaceae bacterium]